MRLIRFVVLLAAVGVLLVSFVRSAARAYGLDRQVRELERARVQLVAQNERLRAEIRRLHDPRTIERIAREELGFVRPGEIAVVLLPASTRNGPASPGRSPVR